MTSIISALAKAGSSATINAYSSSAVLEKPLNAVVGMPTKTVSISPLTASTLSTIFHFLSILVTEVVIPEAMVIRLVLVPDKAALLFPQTRKSPSSSNSFGLALLTVNIPPRPIVTPFAELIVFDCF